MKNHEIEWFKKVIRALFLLVFCASRYLSFSQEIPEIQFEKISTENVKLQKGLSQNSVRCILQDSKGFIWFGTWDGLNKYDGIRYTIFKPDFIPGSKAISDQTVNVLYEDQYNNLWIGTNNGLNKINNSNSSFDKYFSKSSGPGALSNDTIKAIVSDKQGNLWIGTQNGLNKFNYSQSDFTKITTNSTKGKCFGNNIINALFIDSYSNLWIATNNGLFKYNYLKNRFKRFNSPFPSDSIFWSITEDHKQNILFGTEKGLGVIFHQSETIATVLKTSNKQNNDLHYAVHSILVDENQIWVGTMGDGLKILDEHYNLLNSFTNKPNVHSSLSNDYIWSIYKDRTGNVWIGTAWKGVNKVTKNPRIFKHYQKLSRNNSLINNNVWSFAQDDYGNIWIGTQEGISIFDSKKEEFSKMTHQAGNSNSMLENNTQVIYKDRSGNMWIGYVSKGLDKFDFKTGKFVHYNNKPGENSISHNSINAIFQDRSGNMWIGVDNGLNRIDSKSGKISVFQNRSNDSLSLSNNLVYSINEDSKGLIWIGTYNGLCSYNPENNKFNTYRHIENNRNSLTINKIFSIYIDKEDILWIGTIGGGVNRFNPKTNTFRHFTEKDGLANNVVYSIIPDNDGNLWISTNFGLSQFNIKEERFINYDVYDGLQSYEFNLGAAYISNTGEMYFGGLNGFNVFDPQKIVSNQIPPPVRISVFEISGKKHDREIQNGDVLKLNYNQNFFTFKFAALDYTNPDKNQYAYRFKGIDKKWIYTTADRAVAEYTDLNPGTYIFEVIASNNDGIWNKEGIRFTIVISPPWYQTLLFRILVVAVIAFLVYYLVSTRIKNIRNRHDSERRLYELEKQALRLQMNPHFIFNSLNSIQSFVVDKETDKAITYLAKFSRLMRLILISSREAFVALSDEINSLINYIELEQLRFNDKFEFTIECDTNIDKEFTGIPPMIIQPYVENAILHGLLHKEGKGLLEIFIKYGKSENTLFIIIQDNGIGREASQHKKSNSGLNHTSKGMLITKERLEILNKQNIEQVSVEIIDLKDEKGNPSGTRVEINTLCREI